MSNNSKVLALKYRPQAFNQLVGQGVIVESIFNSIKSNTAIPLVNDFDNETFKANLLNVIYPLLEKLSDDDPIIQQNTLYLCFRKTGIDAF